MQGKGHDLGEALLAHEPVCNRVLSGFCGPLRKDLEDYDSLQKYFKTTNVKTDTKFQKLFAWSYGMSRFHSAIIPRYFELLEESKQNFIDFFTVLKALHEVDEKKWHSSFASKHVATVDPNEIVIDFWVRDAFGIPAPKPTFEQHTETYIQVALTIHGLVNTEHGESWVERFDAELPAYAHFTAVKKPDFFFWQARRP